MKRRLAHDEHEIKGHGRERHGTGFSSPLGRWKKYPDRAPQTLTHAELEAAGLVPGKFAKLDLTNGFVVEGKFIGHTHSHGKLQLLEWADCRVLLGSEVLFQPEWGAFDQLVGEKVESVFGGPADSFHYGEWNMGEASTTPSRQSPFTPQELALHDIYKTIRQWREKGFPPVEIEALAKTLTEKFPAEWLPMLETYELLVQGKSPSQTAARLREALEAHARKSDATTRDLILKGLAIASAKD